jgi:hypothetical protein
MSASPAARPGSWRRPTYVAPHDVGSHLAEDTHLCELEVLDVVVDLVPAGVRFDSAGVENVGRKATGLPSQAKDQRGADRG